MARKKYRHDPAGNLEQLRQRAEAKLLGAPNAAPLPAPELKRLMHELEVHRFELEIQNEELRSARGEVEAGLARYTALFDFAPIGYATIGLDGSIREINHAGARLLGRERGPLVGRRFDLYVPAREQSGWENLLYSALESECSEAAEIELRRGQTYFTAQITAAVIDQAERTILLAFEDITEQRQRERHLARVEHALREADRRKDEFLAVLSHELRNPLAPIRSSLFLLTRATPDEKQTRRAHAIIERQVTHLTRLIDDLLDVTRIVRGKIQLQREHVDLSDLVRRTIEDHRMSLENAGLQLDLDIAPGPCWVDADPARLVQIVSNVLGNSEKFTARGGRVGVTLRHRDASFELRVRDTGVGIDPEVLNELFEPFAQAPQTVERARGGLGLGLAMVKGLVELHGGTVAIRSDGAGCGTELTVELPASEGPTASAVEGAAPASVRRRVLIIEDNMDASDSLKDALAVSGHEVRNAYDGPSGLAMAKSFRPEVVICDIGLPHMDGYEVARAFRTESGLDNVYLVALSGYAQPEDKQRATEAGFDRHIAKPPNISKLDRILCEAPDVTASSSARAGNVHHS